MRYAYYPGCAAEATVKEANKATHAVAEVLGISLKEFLNMSCCGAGVLHEENPELSTALNARNFAIAEKENLDILTICNTCLLTMLKAKKELDEDDALRDRVNTSIKKFGLEYTGKVKIKHLLWILIEDYGIENLKRKIKRTLSGIKIAPFYGCHILRPEEILGFENARNPSSLETIISALGATAVSYNERLDCCGFHVMLVNKKASEQMTDRALESAKKAGADIVVTPCTLCQLTLDSYQHTDPPLPVIHLPQLIGLALGMNDKQLGFERHIINVKDKLKVRLIKK